MAQPSLSVRLSRKNPEEFFHKVAECVQTGTGFPAIHSDDVGTMMVMRKGVPSRAAVTGPCTAASNRTFRA